MNRALEAWAHQHTVILHIIDPDKLIHNAHGERFHYRLRDECLNEHRFLRLGDVRRIVETWCQNDHRERPHSTFGYQPPVEFAQGMIMATVVVPDSGPS
jgi:putative transposase